MTVELKIKAKHLALEPAIIRKEEQAALKEARWCRANNRLPNAAHARYISLNNHRRWNVRNEARATELARAYLAGKEYKTVEQKRKPENESKFQRYIVPRIAVMAMKYGKASKVTDQEIIDWAKL